MNKGKKLILGSVLGAATIVTAGAFAGSADAYRGDYTQKGPNCTTERHEQMEQAFESNNYNAWKELMNGRGRVTQVINEQNFEQFALAHKLAEQGDLDGADKIRGELGLRTRNGEPTGAGYGQGQGKGNGDGEGRGQGQGRMNRQ